MLRNNLVSIINVRVLFKCLIIISYCVRIITDYEIFTISKCENDVITERSHNFCLETKLVEECKKLPMCIPKSARGTLNNS